MPVFNHPYGANNVEGSFNDWTRINLTGAGIPPWMPSARVVFDYPEQALISGHAGHAFTITHLGAPDVVERYQGRAVQGGSAGQRMMNMAEVNCWVSKQQAPATYMQRLRQMGDMVEYLFTSGREVEIKNLYTSTATATGIGALIHLSPAQGQMVSNPDPANPDLMRRRYLVSYWWTERT